MLQIKQKQVLPLGTLPTAVLGISGLNLLAEFISELNHLILECHHFSLPTWALGRRVEMIGSWLRKTNVSPNSSLP